MDKRHLIALLRGSIQFEREMTQINADLHRQVMHLNERYRAVSEENARLHAFLLAGLTLTAEQRHLYECYQTELPFRMVLTILADGESTLNDQYAALAAEDEHLREQQDELALADAMLHQRLEQAEAQLADMERQLDVDGESAEHQ